MMINETKSPWLSGDDEKPFLFLYFERQKEFFILFTILFTLFHVIFLKFI